MPLPHAIVLFDIVVCGVLALDFVLIRRADTRVVARAAAALLAVALVALVFVADRPVEAAAIGATVVVTALIGYANALAFLKRGITFSVILNHSRPQPARHPDRDFIGIEGRLQEMQDNGWIAGAGDAWTLTASGHRVVRMRRWLLRLLRTEAVG